MIYSVSFSWKITQIIDEGVAMSFKNQFNNYIHCKKNHAKVLRCLFIFQWKCNHWKYHVPDNISCTLTSRALDNSK